MRYLTWQQTRSQLKKLWKKKLSEKRWIELRDAFFREVVTERDLSQQYQIRTDYRLPLSHTRRPKKPSLDYYDNRIDVKGQYAGRRGIWKSRE